MHFASLKTSPRLQRVYRVLSDGMPHTTLEIQSTAGVCAVGSTISELRRNGYEIECKCAGRKEDGAMVYRYRLLGRAA